MERVFKVRIPSVVHKALFGTPICMHSGYKATFLYKGSPRADSQRSKGLRELKREKTKFKNNYDCKFQLPRNYKRDI